MPEYDYECPQCGRRKNNVVCGMNDRYQCDRCGTDMDRVYDRYGPKAMRVNMYVERLREYNREHDIF